MTSKIQNTYHGIKDINEKIKPIVPKFAGIDIKNADINANIAVAFEKIVLLSIANPIKNKVIQPRK